MFLISFQHLQALVSMKAGAAVLHSGTDPSDLIPSGILLAVGESTVHQVLVAISGCH